MKENVAVVLGASGLIGSAFVRQALSDSLYKEVHVVVRKTLGFAHPKLHEHVIDFSQLEDTLEQIQAQDLFCCLGTTRKEAGSKEKFRTVDYEYPRLAAQGAQKAGLERFFLVSAVGANPKSVFFYNQVKGALEQELQTKNLPGLFVFRPSLLLGKRPSIRMGERIGMALAWVFAPLLKRIGPAYQPVAAEVVAKAMLQVAGTRQKRFQAFEGNDLFHPETVL